MIEGGWSPVTASGWQPKSSAFAGLPTKSHTALPIVANDQLGHSIASQKWTQEKVSTGELIPPPIIAIKNSAGNRMTRVRSFAASKVVPGFRSPTSPAAALYNGLTSNQ